MIVKKGRRSDASGLVKGQFEPDPRGRVFKNLLGIKKKREMDIVEQQEQDRALE